MFLYFQVFLPEEGNVGAKGSWKQSQQRRTKTLGQPAGTFGAHRGARSKTFVTTARKFKNHRRKFRVPSRNSRFIKKVRRLVKTVQELFLLVDRKDLHALL